MTTPFPFVAGAVLQASQLNAITTLPINDQTDDYTLVVGDVGKRVIMNKVAQRTRSRSTTRSSQRATRSSSRTKAQAPHYHGGRRRNYQHNRISSAGAIWRRDAHRPLGVSFTFFPSGGGVGYGTATGGSSSSITVGGQNYTLLTFTSSSTLTVTKAGLFDVLRSVAVAAVAAVSQAVTVAVVVAVLAAGLSKRFILRLTQALCWRCCRVSGTSLSVAGSGSGYATVGGAGGGAGGNAQAGTFGNQL
jgi:hypothetical protein